MRNINAISTLSTRHAMVLAELEATRQAYHALVASTPLAAWRLPSSNLAWTIGQVLDHVALVSQAFPTDVSLIRRFGWIPRPPTWLFDQLNTVTVRLHALTATSQSVRETYDRGFQRTLHILASIREDDWAKGAHYPDLDPFLSGFVTLERLFHYPAHHYLSHAEDIRERLIHLQ